MEEMSILSINNVAFFQNACFKRYHTNYFENLLVNAKHSIGVVKTHHVDCAKRNSKPKHSWHFVSSQGLPS